MEQYITNIQEQWERSREKGEKVKRKRKESEVTIVQNTSMEQQQHHPVVVTVSGPLDTAESDVSTADCDILAHL